MSETFVDPRKKIEHDIGVGQVYSDDRTGNELTLIYEDETVVLLKDSDSVHHRIENRVLFDKYVGAGRYKLESSSEAQDASSCIRALREKAESYEAMDGRKAAHKAEALREMITSLDQSKKDFSSIPYPDLPGVGVKTAARLVANGYGTVADVQAASDDELLALPGVGQGNLKSIREYVESR